VPMTRRLVSAFCAAVLIASLGATAALAGEITGNGTVLKTDAGKWPTGLHGRSLCAYSGQEDLQFLDEDGNPLPETHRGEPGHAQSWGQIPKEFRDFLTSVGENPGLSCNPIKGTGEE
jgi:hypothetical protein